MGLAVLAYLLLGATGIWMWAARTGNRSRPEWLRSLHYLMGATMVLLVVLLLAIGLVGTWGHYGSLGHSSHLPIGLTVVALVLVSAVSASQISPERTWVRSLHVTTNLVLFVGFLLVSLTGWDIVQKYLPTP